MARVLYISYDGISEPLGQSQIIPYLKKLAHDNDIHLITYEKKSDIKSKDKLLTLKKDMKEARINWKMLRYHKTPSVFASIYDILIGQFHGLILAKRMNAEIIHVRSYIPGLIALPIKWITGAKLLFDIRGFWADERVDGGIWSKAGIIFKTVKCLERYLFRAADHIVTLTEASIPKIIGFNYWDKSLPEITVIPTCTDLKLFTPPNKIPSTNPFIFGYVGSFGTWYMMDETFALFSAILKLLPDARMIIINFNEHKIIREALIRASIPMNQVEIIKSPHFKVASYIQKMHAASALIKPSFSKIASAPTKLAEYLGCSVPCIGNYNVGDMEKILEENKIGYVLRSFDNDAILNAAKYIISLSLNSDVRMRCRKVAIANFSLEKGINEYLSIYQKLSFSENKI